MNTSTKERSVERINWFIEKAEWVKTTVKHPPPNVIDFPRIDKGAFFEWKTGAESLIIKITGEDSVYHKNFLQEVRHEYKSSVDPGIGILKALKEEIESGYIDQIKDLVTAEVFTDFVYMAEHLLKNGYQDPAASLIGAILENGLRKIATKKNIPVKNGDDISSLNTKLSDSETYNRLTQQQIQMWKKIRDSAAHGRFEEYKKEDVQIMMQSVKRFLAENL